MKVIKNATLYTMEKINNEEGYIAFKDGKIEEIGRTFNPEKFKDYEIIDAQQKIVTPGLVDPHSHIGGVETGIQFEGNDINEMTHPIYPELRGMDALYPHDEAFKDAYKNGVTTVVTGPGSGNVIGGTFTAVKTVGQTLDDMIVKEEVSMKMALGENPKRAYSNQKKNPSTRMASAALLREWLMRAKAYSDEYKAYSADANNKNKPAFDMKLHSLKRVFEGLPIKVHAHRSDDIMTAIRIAKEFNLEMTIEHGTESHLIPDNVKESGFPVILGPTLGTATKYETRSRTFESAKILDEYDIDFAIMTDHPVISVESIVVQAALFVKAGLDPLKAMKAITINAARLNKIDSKVGSLKEGKDADIVIWDGPFFEIMSKPDKVFINGKLIHNT